MNELDNQKAKSNAKRSTSGKLGDHAKLSVVFVMPNVQVSCPVETNFVGILPDSDPRVEEIAKRSSAAKALIHGFTDKHGSKCPVSVMVVHDAAPTTVKDVAALVSFRNAFAISCVLQSWQFTIGRPNVDGTLFSDYFDFYPYGPTRDGVDLLHIGYALRDYDVVDDFRGQSYPELPVRHFRVRSNFDEQLFAFLRQAWINRFEKGRKNWKANRLFRSLAVAYHASSLPKKNSLWFYDLGVNVALWVSAFETLTHPGRQGRADLPTVLGLLAGAQFSDPVVTRRRRITYRGNVRTGNGAEFLYWRLYDARNAFLHGNPVTPKTALYSNPHRPSSFMSIAPVLYAVALLCFFDWFDKPSSIRKTRAGWVGIESDLKRHFANDRVERALGHILAGKDQKLI